MNTRPTQFGVRENTASSRQQAPHVAANTHSNFAPLTEGSLEIRPTPLRDALSAKGFENSVHGALQDAATGRDAKDEPRLLNVPEVAKLLRVPVSWVYGRMRKRSLERMPGYRLGKYWRFRKDEVLAWVERHCGGSHVA
jgi:excisionase family DNA binding protein